MNHEHSMNKEMNDHASHAMHDGRHGSHTANKSMPIEDHTLHASHSVEQHASHPGHTESHAHAEDHANHVDHTGHEDVFRQRFWGSLLLSLPVLLYTPMLQEWLQFNAPQLPGSQWIAPLFAVIVFIYGGVPFLDMALPEIRNRQPGMMLLISLAISVSFIYSLATLIWNLGDGFFWELVTLIDIMLLGHWIEVVSPGHLLVASIPSFDPRPDTGLAKSR